MYSNVVCKRRGVSGTGFGLSFARFGSAISYAVRNCLLELPRGARRANDGMITYSTVLYIHTDCVHTTYTVLGRVRDLFVVETHNEQAQAMVKEQG
jgi:hypothetical protein